jgi:anaerobic ribonucleoside-triphosphate reductase activating protein
MKINQIKPNSYVDGRGKRVVVFTQGCPFHCDGCQSPDTWNPRGGHEATIDEIFNTVKLLSPEKQVTISGGEPLLQPTETALLIEMLKADGFHVVLYTGYTFEALKLACKGEYRYQIGTILMNTDVIVDGQYMKELDDDFLTYRGSRNQRIIDVPHFISTGEVKELNWDGEIAITEDGDIILPIGFVPDVRGVGVFQNTRMCGERK